MSESCVSVNGKIQVGSIASYNQILCLAYTLKALFILYIKDNYVGLAVLRGLGERDNREIQNKDDNVTTNCTIQRWLMVNGYRRKSLPSPSTDAAVARILSCKI